MIELLIVVGIIGVLAAIVVAAVNPRRNLRQARDAERQTTQESVKKAFEKYVVDNSARAPGMYPGENASYRLPTSQASALPICREGYQPESTTSPVCIPVSMIVSSTGALARMPRDIMERCPQFTGFAAWKNQNRIVIESLHYGKFTGDRVTCSTACPTAGVYNSQVCTSVPAYCGNAVVDAGEQCDDGGTANGDGCSSTCQNESVCGDGNVDGSEACDDGDIDDGDGCSASCSIEDGFGCYDNPSICSNCYDSVCTFNDEQNGICTNGGEDCAEQYCYDNYCSGVEMGSACMDYGQDCQDSDDDFCSNYELMNVGYDECENSCDGGWCSPYELQNDLCQEDGYECQYYGQRCYDNNCTPFEEQGYCQGYRQDCEYSPGDNYCTNFEYLAGDQSGEDCNYEDNCFAGWCSAYKRHNGLCQGPGEDCEYEVDCGDGSCSYYEGPEQSASCVAAGRDCDNECDNGWCSDYEKDNGMCGGVGQECENSCYSSVCSNYEERFGLCQAPGQDCCTQLGQCL